MFQNIFDVIVILLLIIILASERSMAHAIHTLFYITDTLRDLLIRKEEKKR